MRRLVSLVLIGVCATGVAVLAASITAKEALTVAREKAVAWQADALLRDVGADVDKTGRVASPVGWHFTFTSPKTGKDFRVNIGSNKQVLKTEEPTMHGVLKPFTDDFVDSDKAVGEAAAQGLPDGMVWNATLAAHCPAGSNETLCWEVLSLAKGGQVIFVISAKTGKMIGKK